MLGGKPILTYFATDEGLGEPIRLTFVIGNVPFVDRRVVDNNEFETKWKSYSPTGQLPILEINGEMLTQSGAILQYAAIRSGLMPQCQKHKDLSRSIHSVFAELFGAAESVSATSTEDRMNAVAALMAKYAPTMLQRVESLLPSSTTHYTFENRITYIDIVIRCMLRSLKSIIPNYISQVENEREFPKILAVCNAVETHPAVINYMRGPNVPKLYYNASSSSQLDEHSIQPVRWALAISGRPFEEIRIEGAEGEGEAAKSLTGLPPGMLPALNLGPSDDGGQDEWIVDPTAMLVTVADKFGLKPLKQFHFVHAYAAVLTARPFLSLIKSLHQDAATGAAPAPAADSAPAAPAAADSAAAAVEVTGPAIFDRLESVVGLLQSASGYIVGDRLSFADLYVANIVRLANSVLLIPELASRYPKCYQVFKMVISHPTVNRLISMPNRPIKLTYFDFEARAESIEHILKYANIQFENFRFTADEWYNTYKSQSLTGQVPYLDIDQHTRIYEVAGALLYVAELADLLPITIKGRALAASILSYFNSNVAPLVSQLYGPNDTLNANPDTLKQIKPLYHQKIQILNDLIRPNQSPQGYAVDNQLSYIDFMIAFELRWHINDNILDDQWESNFPNLARLYHLVIDITQPDD